VDNSFLHNRKGVIMGKKKIVFSVLAVIVFALPLFAQRTIQQVFTSGVNRSITTTTGNWDLELWADNRGTGGVSCTLFTNGSLSGTWTDGYNTLIRTGRKFPNNTSITSLGTASDQISVRYDVSNFRSNRGATYMTIYGWTRNPLIEYYIIDDWVNWHPGQAQRGTAPNHYTHHGTITVDGGTYDIISARRVNQPSIDNNQTFLQIFNIRQTRRSSGTINVSAHFNRWAETIVNVPLGTGSNITWSNSANLYEVSFCIEGFGGDQRSSGGGSINNLCVKWGNTSTTRLCTWGGCPNCTGGTTPGTHALTTNVVPAAAGTITRSPNAASYAPGTQVTLTRPANTSDYIFSGWSGGGCSGTGNTCTVTMNAATTVTATYTRSPTANLVADGNFPGTSLSSNWNLNVGEGYGGSAATTSVSGGNATINITSVGTNPWEPQLTQQGIELEQGVSYILTFTARSVGGGRDMEVLVQRVGEGATGWTTYGSDVFALTTTAQSFSLPFTMTAASDPSAQLAFNLGGSTNNIIISNVNLTQSLSSSVSPRNTAAQTGRQDLRASAAPNGGINVAFRAAGSGTTTITLYNLKGGLVASERIRTVSGMSYSHAFNPGRLSNGIYVVGVRGGDGRVEQTRVVIPK
jgi:hypothetical protein